MKKFLVTLLLMLPISAYALSVGVEHDVNVSAGGATIGVSQDGNEITVGTGGLTFSNSDTVDFGIAYSTSLLGGLEGGVSYDYTTDSDHVIGVDTTIEYWGLNFDTGVDWNINDTDVSATIGTGYGIFGVDGSLTSNWDVDDFSYEGLDIDAGYTWAVTDTFSVRPNVTVPFDDGFSRGDLTAGVSISLSFGSTPSE
ncbi:MAG: outer membrane beta-barrel protein [Candidatus Pacebacteria bacterium]|jgi:hypothetical protein|nr:outer membrane beta-barrel protein [Candidatus Paceibacterota bacterium]